MKKVGLTRLMGLVLCFSLLPACAQRKASPAVQAVATQQEAAPQKLAVGATVIGIAPDSCTGKGTYTAAELAEVGTEAFTVRDWQKASFCYQLFIKSYADHADFSIAVYNLGLVQMQLKEFAKAQKNFQKLLKDFPGHKFTADARLFLGKSFLEQGNHKMAMQILRNIAYTPDIDWYDKVEAFTQMGRSELAQKDFSLAEEYFWQAYHAYRKGDREEGYADPYGLAQIHYNRTLIKEILMQDAVIESPKDESEAEKQKVFDSLERKAKWLLDAQKGYLQVIRTGHAYWATAAGYKIGALYERLYEEIVKVPSPPGITEEQKVVYQGDLIKKVSVLLRKSLTAFRKVCKVAKRIEVENEWVIKSQASMERLLEVLTKSGNLKPPKDSKPKKKPAKSDDATKVEAQPVS
jgi:tetratricopeptide (TPR) repeat protein